MNEFSRPFGLLVLQVAMQLQATMLRFQGEPRSHKNTAPSRNTFPGNTHKIKAPNSNINAEWPSGTTDDKRRRSMDDGASRIT
jgi:hypothetical protein